MPTSCTVGILFLSCASATLAQQVGRALPATGHTGERIVGQSPSYDLLLLCASAVPAKSAERTIPGTAPGFEERSEPFITDVFSYGGTDRFQLDLSGSWEFRRDPDATGKQKGWHAGEDMFTEKIRIPGAPQAQGIGEPHVRQRTLFVEPFWVRRRFQAPPLEADERVWLKIGGILPAAEIYLNGLYVGYTKSSRTQQRVDVTRVLKPAAENLIAIKVCDFPKVRLDGIWEMAECARNWTGVYRLVGLEITNRTCLIDTYIRPQLASRSVRVIVTLNEPAAEPLQLICEVKDAQQHIGATFAGLVAGQQETQIDVKLDSFTPWSPESPKLYELTVRIVRRSDESILDTVGVRFGMREISTTGTKFLLNGQPLFVRAFGENQYYPETLCPPADKEWFLSRLKRARQYGMNAAKGCVETLPQEYIEAADEAGIMIIQEMPFGLSELRANRYTIGPEFRDYYARELDGLVRVSRNHASVVAYSMSSEMEFANQTQESFDFFSKDLVKQTRQLAPHAVVIDCTGYLNGEDTNKGKRDTDFYASIIPTWMKEVLDETPIITDRRHPTILHEYNWWSCYPDPKDRDKYASSQLKSFWLDTLTKTAKENGQEDLTPTYRKNSLWLQALCRKDGIEYARRCPDVEGYILWLLVDFGQYAEGLLDDFWNPKNVSAEEFLKSNGDTVILLAKEGNRCLPTGGRVQIPLAVSHYGGEVLQDCSLRWQAEIGSAVQKGEIRVPRIDPGRLTLAGEADLDLSAVRKASRFSLQVALHDAGRITNTNDWSFWAFSEVGELWGDLAAKAGASWKDSTFVRLSPKAVAPIPTDASLLITDMVDQALVEYLERGGKCLLLSSGATIENTAVYYGTTSFYKTFRTIPWNAGTSGNSGSVISEHPALADFPHEAVCDLQFVWMVRGVLPMEFSPLRSYGVRPIIRMIDHYAANRNNAHMLEFRVGTGRVLVTTLGILPNAAERIEARYLLRCLADYAHHEAFQPQAAVPPATFLKLFGRPTDGDKTKGPDQLLK